MRFKAPIMASSLRRPLQYCSLLSSLLFTPSRSIAFSSMEEAAAERRRRKRQLRIEPPTSRDRSSSPRPHRDPSSLRLPDSTSSLVGPRLSLHNRIQTLIRSGDLSSASSQARSAIFSPIKPTVFTCNALMSSMLLSGRPSDVLALFHFFFSQQNLVPNIVSYNTLINAHCLAGQLDEALHVYRRILLRAPFTPSVYTYRILVKALATSGRISDSVNLLRDMLFRGHSADALVYDAVISAFIDLGDMDSAVSFFHELRDRCLVYDGVVHATLMEGFWKHGREEDAMDCYQSLLDRNFRMHPPTCNVLLETLLKHGKTSDAQRLFDQMLDEHKPPVFVGVNAETYNIMIGHCISQGRFDDAVEVFRSSGVKPLNKDVGQYNYIIGKLCRNGMASDATKLFDEMLSQSIDPDTATYGFFADAYFSGGGGIDGAVEFFERIVRGGEAAVKAAAGFCNELLVEIAKVEGFEGPALDVFKKMKECGVRPSAAAYEGLITRLCKEGDFEGGRSLFEEMVKDGIVASVELQSFVSESFRKAGLSAVAELMLASSATAVAAPPYASAAPPP